MMSRKKEKIAIIYVKNTKFNKIIKVKKEDE